MKKITVLLALLALAAPFAAGASETRTVVAQETSASTHAASNRINQGPKTEYEVAALFNMLEKKGLISKDELAKEVHNLNLNQFTDPDPYISIR